MAVHRQPSGMQLIVLAAVVYIAQPRMCHEVTGRWFEELDNATQKLLRDEFKGKTFHARDYVQSYQLFTRDCLAKETHFVNAVFHRTNYNTLSAYLVTVRNGTERGFSRLTADAFYSNLYKDCKQIDARP